MKYSEYLNHVNNCEYIKYICKVYKFKYIKKDFEKCNFIGNNKEFEEHFKLCAFYSFKCKLCNENIIHINLRNHIENRCKIGIIKYSNGNKYIGEKKNNINEGFGILYDSKGNIVYEGEFKNGFKEGYGIIYY